MRGAVALVLATALGIGWVVAVVAVVLNPDALTLRGGAALYAVGGTLVGAVVGWLAPRKGDDDE